MLLLLISKSHSNKKLMNERIHCMNVVDFVYKGKLVSDSFVVYPTTRHTYHTYHIHSCPFCQPRHVLFSPSISLHSTCTTQNSSLPKLTHRHQQRTMLQPTHNHHCLKSNEKATMRKPIPPTSV